MAHFNAIHYLETSSTRSCQNIFLYILKMTILYYRGIFKTIDYKVLTMYFNIAIYQ